MTFSFSILTKSILSCKCTSNWMTYDNHHYKDRLQTRCWTASFFFKCFAVFLIRYSIDTSYQHHLKTFFVVFSPRHSHLSLNNFELMCFQSHPIVEFVWVVLILKLFALKILCIICTVGRVMKLSLLSLGSARRHPLLSISQYPSPPASSGIFFPPIGISKSNFNIL